MGYVGYSDTLNSADASGAFYPAINTYEIGATYPFGGALNFGYYQGSFRLNTITWEKARLGA